MTTNKNKRHININTIKQNMRIKMIKHDNKICGTQHNLISTKQKLINTKT